MRNKWSFRALFMLSVLLLVGLPAFASDQEQVVLILPERVNVSGSTLPLGELGELQGPSDLVEQIEKISAGTAPAVGSTRSLTRGHIEVRLRQAGFDPKQVDFQGASTVQIYRVLGQSSTSPTQTQSERTQPGFPSYPVVVARHDLSRGTILTLNDLTQTDMEFRTGTPDPRSPEDFVGLRTTRQVLSGAILNHLNVEIVPLIERGDQVTLVVQMGSLVITAPGEARASGGVGEIISVRNLLSKEIVQAEIINADMVQVSIRGSATP